MIQLSKKSLCCTVGFPRLPSLLSGVATAPCGAAAPSGYNLNIIFIHNIPTPVPHSMEVHLWEVVVPEGHLGRLVAQESLGAEFLASLSSFCQTSRRAGKGVFRMGGLLCQP